MSTKRQVQSGLLITILIIFSQCTTDHSITKGSWETLECIGEPLARHENCFVETGGKFYLLGGRGIKPVNIFDPATQSWTAGTPPPIELHHFQAVSYGGNIYIIGAMTGKYPRETPIENILIYEPENDVWKVGDSIPVARRRGSAGLVVVGDKAIVLCGITDGHWSGHVSWVDEYNFKTGEWKILSDAPRSRDHFSAALHDGKIYCAGGRNSSAATKQTFELTIPEVDVYSIDSDHWETLPATSNLPTQRAGTSSVFIDDYLIIIGGESSQPMAHSTVQALNINDDQWIDLDTLNTGRHGSQAILYNDAIYIAAGSGQRGGRPELSSIEKFLIAP